MADGESPRLSTWHAQLSFEETYASAMVARRLRELGLEPTMGLGKAPDEFQARGCMLLDNINAGTSEPAFRDQCYQVVPGVVSILVASGTASGTPLAAQPGSTGRERLTAVPTSVPRASVGNDLGFLCSSRR